MKCSASGVWPDHYSRSTTSSPRLLFFLVVNPVFCSACSCRYGSCFRHKCIADILILPFGHLALGAQLHLQGTVPFGVFDGTPGLPGTVALLRRCDYILRIGLGNSTSCALFASDDRGGVSYKIHLLSR
jgi:hypothetical protein